MNKKSSRLKPIEKLAEDKEKSAIAEMVSARNTQQSQQQKLNDLMSYRFEYIEQFQSRGKNGMQSSQVQQYQQFISQRDVAIRQQETTLEMSVKILDESQNKWRDKNSHKRALNKVVRRYKSEEFRALEKTEQNAVDEQNTQKYNQKNRENNS